MPENVSPCWTQAHTPTAVSAVAAAAIGGVALVPSEGYLFLCGRAIRVGVGITMVSVCFKREAKGIRAFLGCLVLLVTLGRKATG